MTDNLPETIKPGVGWCLIPPHILARIDLTQSQKMLYGRISGLLCEEGYCYASNKWLGEQLGIKPNTVSIAVNDMKRKGLLAIKLIRGQNNQVDERRIYLQAVIDKNHIGISEKSHRGISEKSKYSNRDKRNREENNKQQAVCRNDNYKPNGEWQVLAHDIATKLGIKTDASWFKLFKEGERSKLDKAYRLTSDSGARNPKLYFFKAYWGFNV